MNEQEWIKKLEAEGYKEVSVPSFPPNMEFPEHTHEEATVHVILKGEITLLEKNDNRILRKGDRYEIPAGTTHFAKVGPEGCTFVVGVRAE